MRLKALAMVMLLACPAFAQVPQQPPQPDPAGRNSGLPAIPDSNAQVQSIIDKMMPASSAVLSMDLDSVLLTSAAKSITIWEDGDGSLRKLLGNLKAIQLRMFDASGVANMRIQPIRDALKEPNWFRYASYSSGEDQIEIWSARFGTDQRGLLLLSLSGNRVFSMNVTGNMRPDQLVSLSGRLGIPDFKPRLQIGLDNKKRP